MAGRNKKKCPVCRATDCENGDDCRNRIISRDQQGMSYYISLISSFILMLAGIVLFISVVKSVFDGKPVGEFFESSNHKNNYPSSSSRKDIEFNNIFFNFSDILWFFAALAVLFVGFFVFLNGMRLRQNSSNNITVQAVHYELESLNQNENSVSVELASAEINPSNSGCSRPQSSNLSSLNPVSPNIKYSKEIKRSRHSSQHSREVEPFIPKHSAHHENMPSPEKIDTKEKFTHEPPKNDGNLALYPSQYPYVICSQENLNIARRIVYDCSLNLRTKYITLEDGFIKIEHLKDTTREYFTRTDPKSFMAKLQAEIGTKMKTKTYCHFSKRIILSIVVMEPISDADFLTKFYHENGIDTSRCEVERNEAVTNVFKVLFKVTPMCYKRIIDKEKPLRINQRAIEYTVIDNPYLELFGDLCQ